MLVTVCVFENDVKMYGTQTERSDNMAALQFENDVKMYGTQTFDINKIFCSVFENDVKMYGTQTIHYINITVKGLRMM